MAYSINDFIKIIAQLRDPQKGCPWDLKQTNRTMIPHLLEETYEVIDAIEKGQTPELKEELGDLLLQVVFLTQLATENGEFDFNDVVNEVASKIIRRHPHVFGEVKATNAEEALASWNAIKKEERIEKGYQSILDNVPNAFPALMRAEKLQKCCAKVGFDWECANDVLRKVEEELLELKQEMDQQTVAKIRVEEELGDLIFSIVNLARHLNCNAEDILMNTNKKFECRFREVETKLRAAGKTCEQSNLEEMDALWDEVKVEERLENKH